MSRAHALPESLIGRPFAVADAYAAGVPRSRLRASDLISPTRGVRVERTSATRPPVDETASTRMARLRDDLIRRAEHFAPALAPGQFFSHETGLALLGAPLPYTHARERALHVSSRRPSGQPRREGVTGHRLQQRQPAPWRARGLPIEHPARLWRQVGALWRLDDLIAAAEYLIHPDRRLIAASDLRAEIDEAGDVRRGILARALAEVRTGAETAEETTLRLALVRAGLPEPELNWELRDANGRFIARLDLAYTRYRVAVEHDGRTHAFDEAQFARDADRWDEIQALGWVHVRILSHHLRPDPQRAVDRVAAALTRAGWRPGRL